MLMVQLPRQPVPASEQPGFGSSAARLFPFGSADSRSCSPVKGESWLSTQPGLFPSRSGNGGSGISHSPVGSSVRWPKIKLEKQFHSRACVFRRRTLAKPLGFHFWTPYPLFKDGGSPFNSL